MTFSSSRFVFLGLIMMTTLTNSCSTGAGSTDSQPWDIGWWSPADSVAQSDAETDVTGSDETSTVLPDANVSFDSTFESWVKPSEVPACVQESFEAPASVLFSKSCLEESACFCADVDLGEVVAAAIELAEESVDLCVMELQDFTVSDALIKASARGVSLRIVIDDSYSDPAEEPAIKNLEEVGIVWRDDHDSGAIMHSKFVVIDQRFVVVSSGNFSVYDAGSNANNLLFFDSPGLAATYRQRMDGFWTNDEFHSAITSQPDSVEVDGSMVDVLHGPSELMLDRLKEEIAGAQSAIHFSIFAFTLQEVREALEDRCGEVEILGLYDEEQAQDPNSVSFDDWCSQIEVLPADVQADFGFSKLHHKLLIVDPGTSRGRVVTGSMNWTWSATAKNDEEMVVIRVPSLVAQYEQEFQARLEEARP